MTHKEILNYIIQHLHEHRKGLRGVMGQEPYRGDLFKLFSEAYNAGFTEHEHPKQRGELMTGDALCDSIVERAPDLATGGPEIETLVRYWDEWRYAWNNVHLRH